MGTCTIGISEIFENKNHPTVHVKVEASPALAVEEKHQESGEGGEEGLQADDLHRHSIKVAEGEDNGKFKCSLRTMG